MNQEKFEEAYIRSNAQLALVVEGRFGDALKRAGKAVGKAAVGAATGKTARKVVKSVGRGVEATIGSAGRVIGAGAKAASDQVDKKISTTARKVYDKAKENAPVVGKVGSALAPTAKAAGDQADKEVGKFGEFAKKKISSAYKGAKEKVKEVLKKGADVAREKVGLDPVKEAYIRSNAQLAFLIAELTRVTALPRGGDAPGNVAQVSKMGKGGRPEITKKIEDPEKAERVLRAAQERAADGRTFGTGPGGRRTSFVIVPSRSPSNK